MSSTKMKAPVIKIKKKVTIVKKSKIATPPQKEKPPIALGEKCTSAPDVGDVGNAVSLKNNPIIRHFAAIAIQRFYRNYIKWERDESGLPVDPILRDGITKDKEIRILYQTIGQTSDGKGRILTRVQYFDIESLWMAILHNNNKVPINPLTNTRFTREQFEKILAQAVASKVISSIEAGKSRKKYQKIFTSNQYTSKFEVNEVNMIKQKMVKARADLVKYCLAAQTSQFLALLNQYLPEIEQDILNINAPITNTTGKFQYLKQFTLLQLACAVGNYDILLNLLELGSCLNKIGANYIYPLHIALYETHLHILPLILLYGGQDQLDLVSPLGSTLQLANVLLDSFPEIYQVLYDPTGSLLDQDPFCQVTIN